MTDHYPVMLEEAIAALAPSGGDTVVDATFGGGGHSRKVLEHLGSSGTVIGIDRDPAAVQRASEIEDRRFTFIRGAYEDVLWRMVGEGKSIDAILFDLGLSSFQIEEARRGFSYIREGPLDMRMDPEAGVSAAEYLNSVEVEELVRVLVEYGDLTRGAARRVARKVVERRPLATTEELAEAVRAGLGWVEKGGNPAKRVFQAVRLRVNDELGELEGGLAAAERLLVPGGRLAAITFHSGEDRIVKRFIADRVGRCVCPPDLPVCVCGARPIFRKGTVKRPSQRELEENPRSASARLRHTVRTPEPLEIPGDTS